MKVIGTAGHIDHGKSTLVRRLTGVDPDRLPEEKRRGMTLDLGFAWLELPSGSEASIIDVPGHERFVKNMLAGAGGIDIALLVVAADEGVMPQTREHLDIIDLLGVDRGIVALTKADLADDVLIELVSEEVRALLERSSLRGSPIVPVSAVTGLGVDVLISALDEAVGSGHRRDTNGLPYLPVDRVFTLAGFGTVVTGTLLGGSLAVGQDVQILPSGRRARVRTLQTHNRTVPSLGAGSRAALNLSGVTRQDIKRGDVVALPGSVATVRRFDAFLRVLETAPFPLEHNTSATLYVGAAERGASVLILGADRLEPGQTGWVQVRTSAPLPLVRAQRFVLRMPSPARTIAGGGVLDVAPRHSRNDPRSLARLRALKNGSDADVVAALLPQTRPRALPLLARSAGMRLETLEAVLRSSSLRGRVICLGKGAISVDGWEATVRRVCDELAQYHRVNPFRRGMSREELRRKIGWTSPEWAEAAKLLAESGLIRDDGATLALMEHAGGIHTRRADADRVLEVLARHGSSPPTGRELAAIAGVGSDLLDAMADAREIVRIADDLYVSGEVYSRMVDAVMGLIATSDGVTVAEVRDALATTRKYALALLEHLDAERITRRVGDVRVAGSRSPACA